MVGKNVYRKTLDVLSIKKWAAIGSAVVIAAGIITMAVQAGLGNRALNFSLEFVGGSTTIFTFDKEYTAEEIEDNIIPVIRDAAGITEVQQQKVADSTQFLSRHLIFHLTREKLLKMRLLLSTQSRMEQLLRQIQSVHQFLQQLREMLSFGYTCYNLYAYIHLCKIP